MDEGWVESQDLEIDDALGRIGSGMVRVSGLEWLDRRGVVYNFEVDGDHTYFVGESGVWVHNSAFNDPACGVTRGMLDKAQTIARGRRIDKVDSLVDLFGGKSKGWRKIKGWDSAGQEWHWYQHQGLGRFGIKRAGSFDPF